MIYWKNKEIKQLFFKSLNIFFKENSPKLTCLFSLLNVTVSG